MKEEKIGRINYTFEIDLIKNNDGWFLRKNAGTKQVSQVFSSARDASDAFPRKIKWANE